VPVTSRIVEGSAEKPLLSVALDLDPVELREVMQRCDHLPGIQSAPGLDVFAADDGLIEAVVRLLRLLDTPEHAKALGPLIRQEILYRLLIGPAGPRLLEICRNGSPASRVSEATAWIRKNYAEGLRIADLAHQVGMSPSSLHQHFKTMTGMTPVQYQRQVRLQEARRSLFFEKADVGEASLRAGYQSHSQFSKDYRQYFGRLPKADALAYARGEAAPIDAYSPARL
jgi:AraC-like DNA-binding protein